MYSERDAHFFLSFSVGYNDISVFTHFVQS
jgi:hypothetical protein